MGDLKKIIRHTASAIRTKLNYLNRFW